MNLRWWSGHRVFVTGHTGFKGSWCCLWLHRLGAEVTGYSLGPPSDPSLFATSGLERRITSIEGDVLDAATLRKAIAASRAQTVVHFAAQSLVRMGLEQPVQTYDVNVHGTANVLEAVRSCDDVRVVVVATSDKCYRLDDPSVRHKEDDTLGGRDPYSASKAGAELVTAGLRPALLHDEHASIAVATVRAGNVIGGGDWARDRLMPDLVSAFAAGKTAAVRNPEAVRPWQHVLDPLAGYLELARSLHASNALARAWNFGPPAAHERPVRFVADEVAKAWGRGARWNETQDERADQEAAALRLDSSAATRELGWSARLDLGAALTWTTRWYAEFYAKKPALELSLADIERYEAIVRT